MKTPPLADPLCSASLDAADCCSSLDEARDVIRRREKYANELMAWMNELRNAPDFTTLRMIQERLRPLCSIPNVEALAKGVGCDEDFKTKAICPKCKKDMKTIDNIETKTEPCHWKHVGGSYRRRGGKHFQKPRHVLSRCIPRFVLWAWQGCGYLEGYGYHPGTPVIVGLIPAGLVAGAINGGWLGALFGAVIMTVTAGSMYLVGAYGRAREFHSQNGQAEPRLPEVKEGN